jgi:hypothetical protein
MKRPAHLDFIRSLPCLVCGKGAVEAAHIRYADARAAKDITGMGTKSDDAWAIPLCTDHHRIQHTMGERRFWTQQKIDPIFVALALYRVSGDEESGNKIVRHAHFYS